MSRVDYTLNMLFGTPGRTLFSCMCISAVGHAAWQG